MCLIQASDDLLKEHYSDLKDRPFFPGLVSYMSSGPVVAMVSLFIFLCRSLSMTLGQFEFNVLSLVVIVETFLAVILSCIYRCGRVLMLSKPVE